jgi:predicted nucleic acid-binding protein
MSSPSSFAAHESWWQVEHVTEGGAQRPSDEELMQQLEEELKKLKVSDLLVQTLYTVSSLGYRKLSAEDRDLDQARLAIEALRALLPVLESAVGEDVVRDFKQVTANLQLAYADAAKGKTPEP